LSVFEKEGSFVNQNFRLQKFAAAVPGPKGLLSEASVLGQVVALMNGDAATHLTISQIWQQIEQSEGAFKELNWQKIPEEGVEVDAGELAALKFVESKNLKFDPLALEEAQAVLA
jgi:NADH-quinone oxidoreductase subunit G